ncbi:MAG TPA: glycosyltransferase [Thermoanaerobaculia bacterium]|nr:glycosyltransferase [Thermoanaerobaculia bacterium]
MSTPHVACTIVSNNYLAYARVLTRSFLDHHPDGKVYVLIVDKPDPSCRYAEEPFTAVTVESLEIPGFAHYSFRYSILELNTAVKPWFLLHLHRTGGYDRVCYFDPDILITGDLSEIYERLGSADALLTPHVTAPVEDDRVPSERDFLLSGIYNLGFLGIAFNQRTLPFLDWWHRRLYKECLHEVERGLFVDQRWMDFAPAFLPGAVIHRDPGCNVAYWNLMHRSLARRDGSWWVDGVPLRFFHFSGYRLDQPETISKYQNRFRLSERPDLQELFREYGERVTAAGHAELSRLPYCFDCFDDGTPVPPLARVALRRVDPDAKRWPDPFATSGPDTFLAWLAAPDNAGEEVFLPRFALLLWDQRPDLQEAFPRPDGEDRARFAYWFSHGIESKAYGEIFTRPVAETLHRARLLPSEEVQTLGRKLSSVYGETPFAADLPEEEIAWLSADAGHEPQRRPRVSRLALMLHQRRSDLRGSYPEPLGASREAFALWFATYGRMEYQLPGRVIFPVLRSLPWRKAVWAELWWQRQRLRRQTDARQPLPAAAATAAPPAETVRRPAPLPRHDDSRPGLNVIGWASAPTGVGEACRGTLLALEEARIPTALWNLGSSAVDDPLRGGNQGLPFDTILFHVNADMTPIVCRQLPRSLLTGRYRIGYWFWELSHFPLAFADSFRHLDEVWAPTRFCLDAFKPISPLEVRWIPPCVAVPTAAPADRQSLGVPAESFLFYFAFDALSIPERKNPDGLLRAFARAVRDSPRPLHLFLKVSHLEADDALGRHLLRRTADLPVTLLTQVVSRAEVSSLMAASDAYVSLHRSEGLGLPLIESMYLGRPVIATGYGGVTDFFDESTGWVIRHSIRALEEARGPYPVGAVWAEPDAEHAAELMLQVATAAPQAIAGRIEAARHRVHEIYSPEAAGARLQRELERIHKLRDQPVGHAVIA